MRMDNIENGFQNNCKNGESQSNMMEVSYEEHHVPEVSYEKKHDRKMSYEANHNTEVSYGENHDPKVSYAENHEQEVSYEGNHNLKDSYEESDDPTALPPIRIPKQPGKWRGYDSKRVFKKQWLKEYVWLACDPNDPTHCFCKVCGKRIRAHKGDLEKHQRTKRHSKKQSTSDILADLIPMSCDDGLNNVEDFERQDENHDISKNSDVDQSDIRNVSQSGVNITADSQQIIYFTDSAVEPSQTNTNSIIDKLVEKYHQKRIENLKVEHKATMELNKEKLCILKQELENEATIIDQKNTLAREEHDIRIKFLQREHEARLKAIEDERIARLHAIEQEVAYAGQEYEKKMRLLDVQLSSLK